MKKKISLWLAIVMSVYCLMPYSFRVVETRAAGIFLLSDTGYETGVRKYLVNGIQHPTAPQLADGTVPEGQTTLFWDFNAVVDANDNFNGMYVLRYFKSDGRKVELTVRMLPGGSDKVLQVTYDVYEWIGGTFVNANNKSGQNYNNGAYLGYMLHTNKSTLPFVSIRDYLSNAYDGTPPAGGDPDLRDRVNNRQPDSINASSPSNKPFNNANPNDDPLEMPVPSWCYQLAPSFNITKGGGYSFQYNGLTAHILWDSINGNFYFGTNGISPGNIYNFQLEYYGVDDWEDYDPTETLNGKNGVYSAYNAQHVSNRNILEHIAEDEFNVIPFADNGSGLSNTNKKRYVDDKEPICDFDPLRATTTGASIQYDFNPIVMKDPNPTLKPAMDTNGMDIRFNLPMAYNETDHAFTAKPSYDLRVTLDIRHEDINYSLGLIIDKVYELEKRTDSTTPYPPSSYTNATVTPLPYKTNEDKYQFKITDVSLLRRTGSASNPYNRLRIRIENLMPSLLFYSAYVYVEPLPNSPGSIDANLSSRPISMNNRTDLQTFIDYNIITYNNRRYIEIIPFNMNTGTPLNGMGAYQLREGPEGNASKSTVEIFGTAPERFLISAGNTTYVPTNFEVRYSHTNNFDVSGINYPYFGSQIIVFEPQPNEANISMPDHFRIDDVRMTPRRGPFDETFGAKSEISFNMRFDVVDSEAIKALLAQSSTDPKELEIVYDVYRATAPDSKSNNYELLDTITLNITSAPVTTTGSSFLITYTGNKTNLSGKPPGSDAPDDPVNFNFYEIPGTAPQKYMYYADFYFINAVGERKLHPDDTSLPPDFRFPEIYFLNVVPVSMDIKGASQSPEVTKIPSLFASITLDDITKLPLPPPRNLQLNKNENMAALDFKFTIPGDAVDEYFNYLGISKADEDFIDSVELTADVYIGQYDSRIKTFFFPTDRNNNNIIIGVDERIDLSARDIDFSDEGTVDPDNKLEIDLSDYINDMRTVSGADTGVVRINNIPVDEENLLNGLSSNINMSITGLDPNQQYYVFADLVMEMEYNEPPNIEVDDYSILSTIVGATTVDDINVPGPDERVPSAPEITVVPDSVTSNTATLNWTKFAPLPDETSDEYDIVYEYEIIRLQGRKMTDELFNTVDSDLIRFFNSNFQNYADDEKTALRTMPDEPGLQIYEGGAFRDVNDDEYSYSARNAPVVFTDMRLMPNKLYFYYVRTVRKVTDTATGEETTRYSVWSSATVTTTPVRSPVNLKIESVRIYEDTTGSKYDPKTEVAFSFDTPPLTWPLTDQSIVIYYQIKEDSGDWQTPVAMQLSQLNAAWNGKLTPDGTMMHFIYKISGLKPNTLYSLRLYILDKDAGDQSMYSEIKQFKTDMSQEEYDDKHDTDGWLDFLRQQLQELIKDPYWLARDTAGELVAVYRPGDMFNAVLGASIDAAVTLHSSGADASTYYIPISVFIAARDAGKGFRVVYDDMTVMLPANFINLNYSEAVLAMANRIKTKDISDYFIRIVINRARAGGLIDGEPALGRITDVSMELVGVIPSAGDIKTWDAGLYVKFAQRLDAEIEKQGVRDEIERMVKRDTSSEEILRYIDRYVSNIKTDLIRDVYNDMRTGSGILSRYNAEVAKLDAAMLIISKTTVPTGHSIVSGYQQVNSVWTQRPVSDYLDGKGMAVTTTGTYAFTGRTVSIAGSENMQDGDTLTALVAKYGLDSYLGRGTINMNAGATRYMVAGCVALMAGAPKSAEPIAWIASNLNMSLSSRSANGGVQTQEAAAMVMALYEKKTGTKVSSITIRNYALTAGMALDDRYAQAVRAAFEIGVLTDTGISPGGSVTVRQFLEMLAALDKKVKL